MAANLTGDFGKLIMRLTLGILVGLHGLHKLIYGIDPIMGLVHGAGLPGFVAYGVYLGEVLGPLLLIFGLYARIGAALIAINMLFAFGLVHIHSIGMLNGNGGWELELQGMYLFIAVGLLLTGPGRLSLNQR